MNLVKTEKFVCTEIDENHNKFWQIWLYDDGSTKTRWGRVSETDKAQEKTFPPGVKNYDSIVKSKLKKGYRKVEIVGDTEGAITVSPQKVANVNVEEIAAKQIAKGNKIVEGLVRYLSRKNRHTITQNTNITYNEATGLFQTPIGVVTQQNIDDARNILAKLFDFVKNSQFEERTFKDALQDYLMLIPSDVGRKRGWHQTFLPDVNAVSAQNSILDALQASLDIIMGNNAPKYKATKQREERIFNVSIEPISDPTEIERIRSLYDKTRQRTHSCYRLDVKKVYGIKIASMEEGFEDIGRNMKNIWELWHGTQVSNVLSIMSKGMIIPPASASYCTGRAFGNGIYFSDQSTKSLNYAYGYWSGTTDNNCFMLLADVAMGRYYEPVRTFGGSCPAGYDSTFAKGGGVFLNNEMVIYRTQQARIKRLVEFA